MDMGGDTEVGGPNAITEEEGYAPQDCEYAANSLVEEFGDPFGRDFPIS